MTRRDLDRSGVPYDAPMPIEIRVIAPDEFTSWIEALHVPFFLAHPAAPAAEFRRSYTDLGRLTWR